MIISLHQTEIVNLEDLVPAGHMYRKFVQLWNFKSVELKLSRIETDNNHKGYGVLRLFKCLLLQFMEDVSYRELERLIQENNSAKWFCGIKSSRSNERGI